MSIGARRSQRASVKVTEYPGVDAESYAQVVMTDSPTLYYPLQEQRGAVNVQDAAGGARHATYHGSVSLDYAWNPYQFAPIALGRHAMMYNEIENTAYMHVPDDSLNVTSGFTFEAWLFPLFWSNWNAQVFNFGDISMTHGYQNTMLGFTVGSNGFSFPDCGTGKWTHVVVTVPAGGGSANVYYDGQLVASGAVGALTQKTRTEMYIGRAPGGGNTYYTGGITQVAVYPTALTASRVQEHFQASKLDVDPVWHGTAEWHDDNYYQQFTNGSLLANPAYVATADWMPGVNDQAGVTAMKPMFDIGIATRDDYSFWRNAGMYTIGEVGVSPGTPGVENIGMIAVDEPDMSGSGGLALMQQKLAEIPEGVMSFVNFGSFITMGLGAPELTQGDFTNAPGLDLQSCDMYWYSTRVYDPYTLAQWGLTGPDQIHRACNYGIVVERARSTFDVPRPQWGFVEVGHPNVPIDSGGANPDQVEGAVWGSIIGGARGIIYFHHNFVDSGAALPVWSPTEDYEVNTNLTHNGTLYFAALKPAVGEEPFAESYTWVRFDSNSGAGLNNNSGRHPDLPAKLAKIKQDLQTVALAINSPSIPHLCHKDIYSTYRPNVSDGKKYIIALPGLGAPQGGTFEMYLPKGQAPSSIEVVGEGRTITPINGTFTDTFAAEYTHHIYRW